VPAKKSCRKTAGHWTMKATDKEGGQRIQYAALPYRRAGISAVEVLLVTSRETRRWVIPKGWPQKRRPPYISAAREALEEAGVVGRIDRRAIGSYSYRKRLKGGGLVNCHVQVFALEVGKQRRTWREKAERTAQWVSSAEAANLVEEEGLREIIRNFLPAEPAKLPASGPVPATSDASILLPRHQR